MDATEFEVSQMFEAAVAAGLQLRWSEERLREEFEAAMESAMDPEFD